MDSNLSQEANRNSTETAVGSGVRGKLFNGKGPAPPVAPRRPRRDAPPSADAGGSEGGEEQHTQTQVPPAKEQPTHVPERPPRVPDGAAAPGASNPPPVAADRAAGIAPPEDVLKLDGNPEPYSSSQSAINRSPPPTKPKPKARPRVPRSVQLESGDRGGTLDGGGNTGSYTH